MTSAGSNAVNPLSMGQHLFPVGTNGDQTDISRVLGPNPGTLQTDPYDRVAHTNYDYPEAVKNQTLFVKSTIEGFIVEGNDWTTTIALPWAQTDQMNVRWNEWHFNNPLADRVPHEGTSRLITSSKREFKTHVVRRGLAFVMEADFANTAEGVEQYARNVMSIGQAVQETQNHDTVHALLTCKNYHKIWNQRFGSNQVTLSQIEDNEIETFGSVCFPEGDDRFSTIIEDHKRLMAKQGSVPNMLVCWPGSTIYMSMVPPMRTEYDKAGPDGVMRRERGPDSLTVFRGLPIFEARDFDVYENAPPVQLLTRPVQVAEYYPMRCERRHEDMTGYTSKERGTVIYDENKNQWVKITLMQAFENSKIFGDKGEYHPTLQAYVAQMKGGMGDDDDDDESGSGAKSCVFAHKKYDGSLEMLRYFGQMEEQHMTHEDVQRVAETCCGMIGGQAGVMQFQKVLRLLERIEDEPYNGDFFMGLRRANPGPTEQTPEELQVAWGVSASEEWKPNKYGSLDLPAEKPPGMSYPIGYANGPGLRTLAAEAMKETSPWREAGKEAKGALDLLLSLLDHITTRLPSCEALNGKNRSPWFHKKDPLTTFVEILVGVSRDPIFIYSGAGEALSGAPDAEDLARSRLPEGGDEARQVQEAFEEVLLALADQNELKKKFLEMVLNMGKGSRRVNGWLAIVGLSKDMDGLADNIKALYLDPKLDTRGLSARKKAFDEALTKLEMLGSESAGISADDLKKARPQGLNQERQDAQNLYRSPLTSSLVFYNTVRGVNAPSAVPGDPSADNERPLRPRPDADVGSSQSYRAIGELASHVMSAHNYATISELQSDYTRRSIHATSFARRRAGKNFRDSDSDGVGFFGMSDDSASRFQDDSIDAVFMGASMSSQYKRARIGAMEREQRALNTENANLGAAAGDLTAQLERRWTDASSISNPIVKMAAHAFLLTPCNRAQTWRSMIHNDVLIPIDFLLWRPMITHDMASAILMKGGLETGANLHGGSNASQGNDVVSKLKYFNFTFRSKAVVWKEKNVSIIENIKFEGYAGGHNTQFIKNDHELQDDAIDRPSLIAMYIPMTEKPLERRLNITGRMRADLAASARSTASSAPQYSTAAYYDSIYGFSSMDSPANPGFANFFEKTEANNFVGYQGHQYLYNPKCATYSRFIEPQGHLKRNMVYPGAASVLNGTAKCFERYNYEHVNIE